MANATRKAWTVREAEGGGYHAVAENLDTGASVAVGPWGRPLPTVEAALRYIAEEWHGGADFPGSIDAPGELGPPDPIVESHCLADLC
jgi:hypothetical protein